WFDLFQDPELERLVETALQQNRDMRVALASIDEFRAQYGATLGALLPRLDLNGQGGTQKIVIGSLGTSRFDVLRATADLQWEIDFWGRLRRATEAARADLLAREESERAVVLSLVSDVATAYLELRELDLDLEISKRTLASNEETLRLARRRFDQGLISELDVRQFESEVASPAARVADFERQIAQKENQLSVLVGRNPGSIPRGRPLTETLAPLAIPTGLPASLIERRPDVRQAGQELHAAMARIGVAEGALMPTITLTGQYGTQSQDLSNLFKSSTEIYQLFGGISVPIFTGGQVGKQVDVARARAEQARYGYEQTVLLALAEVNDALVGVRASRDVTAAQERQAAALRSAYHLADRRYENGSRATSRCWTHSGTCSPRSWRSRRRNGSSLRPPSSSTRPWEAGGRWLATVLSGRGGDASFTADFAAPSRVAQLVEQLTVNQGRLREKPSRIMS
ncbi:MAG TPA: efflux transporter outer membrane subunit, partial [Candidatus Eisenbacteria bacterium]